MKKYMTRPVVVVMSTAVLLGGVAPFLVNGSVEATSGNAKISVGTITATPTTANKEVVAIAAKPATQAAQTSVSSVPKPASTTATTKVVMNDEGKNVTRYNLRELALNDPDTLQILLKQQAEHLYILVDELDLDTHLQTFMQDHPEEWERIYQEHYRDIWLEVRFLDDQEIVSVDGQVIDNKVYIKGIVTPNVTKVVVVKSDGDTISVVPTSEHTFAVSFASDASKDDHYATVKAYAGSKMVESEKVKLIEQKAAETKLLMHAFSVLDAKQSELSLRGIVTLPADKVEITYNGVTKSVKVQKLWDGVGSFNAKLKGVKNGSDKALIEVYQGDKKLESTSVAVQVIHAVDKPEAGVYTLNGTAEIDSKQKKIKVNGTIAGWNNKKKNVSVAIVAPNGDKKVVKPNAQGQFSFTFSQNGKKKAFDQKATRLQLWVDGKSVLEKELEYIHEGFKEKQQHDDWKNKDKKQRDRDDDRDDD